MLSSTRIRNSVLSEQPNALFLRLAGVRRFSVINGPAAKLARGQTAGEADLRNCHDLQPARRFDR